MKVSSIIIIAASAILIGGIFSLRACAQMPVQKATIEVTDQDGKPVKDALVEMGFWGGPSGTEFGSNIYEKQATTTETGVVEIEGGCSNGDAGIGASKSGYYKAETDLLGLRVVNRRWEPWNPTIKLQLKEIRKPIPMYALDTERGAGKIRRYKFPLEVPNGPVGFDLMAHDWVQPYGKGKITDIILEGWNPQPPPLPSGRTRPWEQSESPMWGSTLNMRLPNPNDGIIGPFVNEGNNILKSTHDAPVGPYKTEMQFDNLTRRAFITPGQVDVTERWFAFRIRTVVDADGKVISSHYGKFYGYPDVGMNPKGRRLSRLCYFINPTPNSRNLEWDQKTNLFTDLDKQNWPENP